MVISHRILSVASRAMSLGTVAVAACGVQAPVTEQSAQDAMPKTTSRETPASATSEATSTSASTIAMAGRQAGKDSGAAADNQSAPQPGIRSMSAKPGADGGSGTTATATAGSSAADAGSGGRLTTADAGVAAGSVGRRTMSPATGACDPAARDPAPEMASFKLLGGYQSLSEAPTTGPATPVIEVHSGFDEWTVYRPEPLEVEGLHEILIWANGGCLKNSTIQGHFLLELASWGFVVVADGFPQDNNSGQDPAASGIRSGPDAEPMVTAMNWITAENERPCSPFFQKLDVKKLALGGQSCGGMMTMLAAGDPRVTTAMVFNSGTSGSNAALLASYHAPMLFLAGGSSDFLSSSATANVNAIDNVPIFYGNLNVGHGGTWESTNGGEMGRVALGWLKWKLQGDISLERMFVGADCELCKPPSEWTVVKKMID